MSRAGRRQTLSTIAIAAAVVVLAACSGDDAAPTTVPAAAAPTTAAPTTTTLAPTTTTAPPTTTSAPETTTTAGPETVGDPAQLEALIDTIAAEVAPFFDAETLDVPAFDLTTPDPITAVEELNRFDQWVAGNYPYPGWSEVMSFSESPAAAIDDKLYDRMFANDERRVRPGEPYVFYGGTVVDLQAVDLPEDTVENMPTEAVGVLYESESGPFQLVIAETGEVVESIDGWERRVNLAIIVPTSSGWKFWDTLVDYRAGET